MYRHNIRYIKKYKLLKVYNASATDSAATLTDLGVKLLNVKFLVFDFFSESSDLRRESRYWRVLWSRSQHVQVLWQSQVQRWSPSHSHLVRHVSLHLRNESCRDVLVFAHALQVAAQTVHFGNAFVEVAPHRRRRWSVRARAIQLQQIRDTNLQMTKGEKLFPVTSMRTCSRSVCTSSRFCRTSFSRCISFWATSASTPKGGSLVSNLRTKWQRIAWLAFAAETGLVFSLTYRLTLTWRSVTSCRSVPSNSSFRRHSCS